MPPADLALPTSAWAAGPPGSTPGSSAHRSDVVAWRRSLHAVPELGRAEHRTTELVARRLMAAGLEPRTLPGGTGLVCDIGFGDRCVALRADLDALPLQEATDLPFASTIPDVMHACGHDAHTAMLLGAGLALAAAPALPGRVRLIFQPAEEVQPGGAMDMVADGAMEGVAPHLRAALRPAAGGGQARHPESGRSRRRATWWRSGSPPPADTPRARTSPPTSSRPSGLLITQLPLLLTRHVDPRSGTVLVWGAVQAGQAANAIPQHGVLRGTLRTADHATWGELEDKVRMLVASVLAPLGVGYVLEYLRGVPPVVNDEVSTDMLAAATATVLGPDAAVSTQQSSGGEDFAWYLDQVPGAMARLGVWPGHGPMRDIHQPTFDLDERALPVGVRVLANVALSALAT